MENYKVVPNIISGKDLDYLSDMFSWNYGALKKCSEALNKVTGQDIKDVLNKGVNLFNSNLNMVLEILKEGGSNE